jgi:superfamily II DNA/RNA helicase
VRCAALHADLSQGQRTAAIEGFRAGRHHTLVATDVAARGLDIDGIVHVVNYEVPDNADAYVHRVGRTGRADAAGTAVTLVGHEELGALRALEQSLELTMDPEDHAGQVAGHSQQGVARTAPEPPAGKRSTVNGSETVRRQPAV